MIIPAILTKSKTDLKRKLKMAEKVADWAQIDIMDGKFVKQKSLSLKSLHGLKTPLKLEVHLMVKNPENYFADCQKIKTKRVFWHLEGAKNPNEVFKKAGKYNIEQGIALNPKTGVLKLKPYLKDIKFVLLLAVNPGKQGQKFQTSVFKKIKEVKKMRPNIKVEIDGGVSDKNIKKLKEAGADIFAVGSYLFKSKNIKERFSKL